MLRELSEMAEDLEAAVASPLKEPCCAGCAHTGTACGGADESIRSVRRTKMARVQKGAVSPVRRSKVRFATARRS